MARQSHGLPPGPKPPPRVDDWLVGGEEDRPARPRWNIWRALELAAAVIGALLFLSVIFGTNAGTCVLSIPAGMALYEVWYLTVERLE